MIYNKACSILRFVLALGCLSVRIPALAQQPPEEPSRSAFETIIKTPTGKNGYEELTFASDLARSVKWSDEAMLANSTLTMKRKVLAEPAIQRALAIFRAGLAKPIRSPRNPEEMDENTLLPEFAGFRHLARLLRIEQYVLLADGRIPEAIASMNDGLRLGYRVQTDTLISGLVGITIDTMVMDQIARHLDQFSLRDCDQVLNLVEKWLDAPSPVAVICAMEKEWTTRSLAKKRGDTALLTRFLEENNGEEEQSSSHSALRQMLQQNPMALDGVIDQTIGKMNAYFDAVIRNANLPAWERKPVAHRVEDNTPSGELFDAITTDMSRILDRYDTDRAQLQLLGLHTAIRRYRWMHNRLPNSLAELRLSRSLQRLTLDPFTGKTLLYTRKGEDYTLASAGPFDQGTDDKPASGQRVPLVFPRPRTD